MISPTRFTHLPLLVFSFAFMLGTALCCPLTWAGDAAKSEAAKTDSQKTETAPTLHIQQLEPDYPVDEFAKPGVVIHPAPQARLGKPSETAIPQERNQWLAEAGLSKATEGWDELSRDTFTARAGFLSPEAFELRYPRLPKAALRKFQALVKKNDNSRVTEAKEAKAAQEAEAGKK